MAKEKPESKKEHRSEMKFMRKGGAPAGLMSKERKEMSMKSGGTVKKKGC